MTDFNNSQIDEMSFETAYDLLEEVLTQLESGELPLEASVAMYERGKLLSAHCQTLLDEAETRIQKIDDAGNLTEM
ncbi:MAG: exodeoxyribonuclease VII small subunit [Chloroflexota bacterium]